MRIDHVAYQQATRVASYGLGLQFVIGLTMLILGAAGRDTALVWASSFALLGVVIWLSLLIVFHQHKLERLESLEADELAASRGTTIFDREIDATRVAARRLELMHRWLMPVVSVLVAISLAGLGYWFLRTLRDPGTPEAPFTFSTTPWIGWSMAVCLVIALVSFIFSRFVAGMAKQPAWQNLRGGAGFMVGNAVVCLALAVGFGFQFAQKPAVIEGVVYGIAIFMMALAAEIALNFVLNLYRPRRAGETPRPAFDSRALSLLAAPDSIVRSINEAVNYQFGFDITSSWGYQLLLRSVGSLIVVGALVMFGLSCLVTVEPDQRAVRLRFGRIVEIHGPGLMTKLPWPIETVELHQVGRVRDLSLALNPVPLRRGPEPRVNAWVTEDTSAGDRKLFVAGPSRLGAADPRLRGGASVAALAAPSPVAPGAPAASGASGAPGTGALLSTDPSGATIDLSADAPTTVGEQLSLVDAEVVVLYRVRPEQLREHLEFASDSAGRRTGRTVRERAMRAIALRELSEFLPTLPLEDVLSPGRSGILDALRARIQKRFDDPATKVGVDVVAVTIPLLRPPHGAAAMFEEYTISVQANREGLDIARKNADVTMAVLVSGAATAEQLVRRIDAMQTVAAAGDVAKLDAERRAIETMILNTRGSAAATIESAEAKRWQEQMQARSDANRLLGDLPLYEAAPELYRQRLVMQVLARALPSVRVKYLIGVPADRVRFEVEMLEADSGLNFLDAVEAQQEKKPGQ